MTADPCAQMRTAISVGLGKASELATVTDVFVAVADSHQQGYGMTTTRKVRPGEEISSPVTGTGNAHSAIHDGTFCGPVVQADDVVCGSPSVPPPPRGF
jgi:hypothetical protein